MDYAVIAAELARHGVRVAPDAVQRAEWQARVHLDDQVFARTAGASTETQESATRYLRFLLEGLGVADGSTVERVAEWRRTYTPPIGVFTSHDPQALASLALVRRSGAQLQIGEWRALVGEGQERVAAQHRVDLALHLVDLTLGVGLEPQREIRIRVRGAHEPPAAARKDHTRAVRVDRLVAPLELARHFVDHPELLTVGARRLELRRGPQVGDRLEEPGEWLGRPRGHLDDLARGEDAVIDAVVVLGEEHVAADLASEQDVVVAHLPLEMRVARLPHDGHAAMLADVVDQRLRGLHVEHDLGARMAREQVARQKDQDQIGLVAPAALVDDPDAIGIAVVRDADVGAHLDDLDFQILDVALVLRVGQVVRKGPVRLAVQLDDVAADAAQELRAVEPGDAVAGVDHDLEATGRPDHAGDGVEVVLTGASLAQPAGPVLVVPALHRRPQALDLVLGQRRRTRVHPLHAVVLDGVVVAGAVGARLQLPVGGREVENRRGDRADVDGVG